MKLKYLIVIAALLLPIVSAQGTDVLLNEVSGAEVNYYCFECNPNPEGQEGNIVWYGCDKIDHNCQLSVRRKSDDHEIAVLKFNKAKVYFDTKKLAYILAGPASTNPNAVPFDIAGIEIPYVSAGDRINFLRANRVGATGINPINAEYFQKFYYEVGTERTPAIDDITTPLGTAVKRRETLPLSLCGQEFFDVTSERIRNRDRNSFFFVEKRGPDCIVSAYRLSTHNDAVWLSNNQYAGIRTYPCGKNHVYFATQNYAGSLVGSEQESILTNFECVAERDIARLNCPESNQDEKRLCEEQTKNIIFQAGSTKYYITLGKITVLPADTTTETVTSTSILVSDAYSIKAFYGPNVFDITPIGNAEIRFSGHLDDENNNAESRLLLKEGSVATETRGQLADYVLNRPQDTPEQFKYSLIFEENWLKSINDASNEEAEQGRVLGGTAITGLRISENLRTFGSILAANQKTYNLFPLREGESNVMQSGSYIIYTVRREGMTLREIARAQPGMPQLEGSQLTDFMEQIRETTGLYYNEAEGGTIDQEFRGPRDWATPNKFGFNTAFRAGDIVLIPTGRTFQGNAGNRLTATDNPARAGQNLEQRAQRRVRRTMDDTPCTSLGGECQYAAIAGKGCVLTSDKEGNYVRNKCNSNPSTSYLCCLPPDAANRARGEVQCRSRGGQCISTDRENVPSIATMGEFCDKQVKPSASPNDQRKWTSYGEHGCIRDDPLVRFCCAPLGQARPSISNRQVSTNECDSQAGSCIPVQDNTLESYGDDYHRYCKTRRGYGRSLGKCQQPSQQLEGITYVCCAPGQEQTPSTQESATRTSTPQPQAATTSVVRGTQCTTNDDCDNIQNIGDAHSCYRGRCTNCADRDHGPNAAIPSFIAVTRDGFTDVELDECKEGDSENKWLEEKICRVGTENIGIGKSAIPGSVELNCKIALNNNKAKCLISGMTSKGPAAYCGIPPRDRDAIPGDILRNI